MDPNAPISREQRVLDVPGATKEYVSRYIQGVFDDLVSIQGGFDDLVSEWE